MLISGENRLSVSKAQLARLVGISGDFDLKEPLTERPDAVEPDILLEALKEKALSSRPEIKALETEKKNLEKQLGYAKAAYWPTLSLEGIYSRKEDDPTSSSAVNETLYAGIKMTFTIFDGGSKAADVTEASARLRQAGLELEDYKKTVVVEVENAYLNLMNDTAILKSLKDRARPGTGLFTVVQTDPIRLNFTVPEKDIARLRLGQEVIFSIDALHGKELKGRLSIIYPSLDEKTRTLKVEARVSNPEGVLKPGLFAKVVLYTGKARDALLIPATALLYEEDRTKVFVVEDERAKQRHVKIGQRHGDLIEVLEGIGKDDKVITVGQQALMDGLKVNVAR